MGALRSTLIGFTWAFAIIFLPIETYLSFSHEHFPISGYAVNVVGVGIALWGALGLRRGDPRALGVLTSGWGWTTAVFWRGTNLRFWLASEGEQLSFGPFELWMAPIATTLVAAAFVGSLILLLKRGERYSGT
jgi:hypothetical protein